VCAAQARREFLTFKLLLFDFNSQKWSELARAGIG
jgi:hypothetical protein